MAQPYTFGHVIKGDRSRPILLFLHGFMGNKDDWRRVMPSLTDSFCCLAVDLPGHGDTVVIDESLYRVENVAAALCDFLDQSGCLRPHVVGYSMGGRLAFFLAVNHADRFGAFVIESASPGLRTAEDRRARLDHDDSLARKLSSGPLEDFLDEWYRQPVFASLNDRPGLRKEIIERRLKNDPTGLARSLRFMGSGAQPSLWERLSAVRSPMLLITGEKDEKFSGIYREVAGLCPASRMRIISECGHNVHLEKPAEYIKAVRSFLLTNK